MKRFKTLQECIDQLKKVNYKDEIGHELENNVAFIQLIELAHVNNLTMPVVSNHSEQLCFNCGQEHIANEHTGLCKQCYVYWNNGKSIKTK